MTELSTLIVAGTFSEAQRYARAKRMRGPTWRYVASLASLIGAPSSVTVVYTGNYWLRQDLREIDAALQAKSVKEKIVCTTKTILTQLGTTS